MESLPLLDLAASWFKQDALSDAYLLGCQHILPSAYGLLMRMFALGLRRERVALIGKSYSTSRRTFQQMVQQGVSVCPSSLAYDSHRSFDEMHAKNVERLVSRKMEEFNLGPRSRVILLDDGGQLIAAASRYLSGFQNVLAVEQTSSGYHKLRHAEINFPVINVARSYSKLGVESPMIALSQERVIRNKLKILGRAPSKMLILGGGPIGKALYRRLSRDFSVTLYDKEEGLSELRAEELNFFRYDVIIGTTGSPSLPRQSHPLLAPGTILISASSSDVEFDAVHLRRRLIRNTDCHIDLNMDGLWMVNSGFPVNFYGSQEDNVPLKDIQLTFALLLAGVCSHPPEKPGLVDLAAHYQDRIIENYFQMSGEVQNGSWIKGEITCKS